jgi:hypothetical protein
MSTQVLKTINHIVTARARMIGAQSGPTVEEALADARGYYSIVRPGLPTTFVAANGGWTTQPAEALCWNNTADLLRAAQHLNVSGLRIINAPTPEEIAQIAAQIAASANTRKAAIAARNVKREQRAAALKAARTAALPGPAVTSAAMGVAQNRG